MHTERLHAAAIALQKAFGDADVQFGIFGGYAVTILGGVRESKDIDCIASLTRARAIVILNEKTGFSLIPQTRQDYVHQGVRTFQTLASFADLEVSLTIRRQVQDE